MTQQKSTIPRVKSIDAAEFEREFYAKNAPVIVEDYAKAWPAVDNWDAPYLCDHLTDTPVLCSKSSSKKHPDFEAMQGRQYRPVAIAFEDYIRHICTADLEEIPKIALNRLVFMSGPGRQHDLHLHLEGLAPDFKVPELIRGADLDIGAVWMQGQGAQSWLHCDPFENLYVQVRGRKHIELIDPRYSAEVYYNNNKRGYCEVDAFEPDFERFPLYAHAPILETVLEPGEMLYLPIFWFHAVESLDPINISMNWWYRPQSVVLNQPSMSFALKQLLSYGFDHAPDDGSARALFDVGAQLQNLLLSDSFAKSEAFWLAR